MVLLTTAMISQRSPSPAVGPPISPPTKAPLWWAAPATICPQLTLALAITLVTLILAQATTLAIPHSPLSQPHSPQVLGPRLPSFDPVATPPPVHNPGPASRKGVP